MPNNQTLLTVKSTVCLTIYRESVISVCTSVADGKYIFLNVPIINEK